MLNGSGTTRVAEQARVATPASGDGLVRRRTLPQGLLGQAIGLRLETVGGTEPVL
jgi:hypothetical protein